MRELFGKKILLLISLFILTSCDPACIDADDFGYPKISVSSRPSVVDRNIIGDKASQVMKWQNSGYIITGKNLAIMVRNGNNSRWSPWYGEITNQIDIPEVVKNSPVCIFGPSGNWCPDPNASDVQIGNINPYVTVNGESFVNSDPRTNSCYFVKGVGIYAMITSDDPNKDEITLRTYPDDAVTFHLGEDTNLFLDTKNGNSVPVDDSDDTYEGTGGYNGLPPTEAPRSGKLYFKILDKYYDDNGGQYKLIFKSGVERAENGVIAKIVKFVQNQLNTASETLFNGIISDEGGHFRRNIQILLTLYIIFNAIFFIFGITQMSQSQFAIHLFKIAIIMQLITTETSWNFFNDTVFSFFTQGVNQLICIIGGADSGCTQETMWNSFDNMIQIFFSRETWIKAGALVMAQFGEGFVFVIALACAGLLFIIALFKAVIFILVAFLATSILIVLSPIFIPFLLFKITSELFNKLISQFFGYLIQPIIVVASLALWKTLVVAQLQKLLGFRVCTKHFAFSYDVFKPRGVHVNPTEDLKWIYAPGNFDNPLNKDKISLKFNATEINQIPSYFKQNTAELENVQDEIACQPYECLDLRFPDLPFLRPYIPEEWDRIQQIAGGTYVTFSDILIFILFIYLMYMFNNMAPEIARGISGSGGYNANINTVAKAMTKGINNAVFHNKIADIAAAKVKSKVSNLKIRGTTLGEIAENVSTKVNEFRVHGVGKVMDYATSPTKVAGTIAYKIGTKTPGIRSEINKYELGRERKHAFFDKIGGTYDSSIQLAKGIRQQALSDGSFGILGTDHKNAKTMDKNGNTSMDRMINEYAHYRGIKNQTEIKNVKENVQNLTKSGNQLAKWGTAAAVISAVNPFVGGAIGLVGLYKAGKTATVARQNLNNPNNNNPNNNNNNNNNNA